MDTLANSDDPDEMLQNAAFHLGLYCLEAKNNRCGQKYIIWKF